MVSFVSDVVLKLEIWNNIISKCLERQKKTPWKTTWANLLLHQNRDTCQRFHPTFLYLCLLHYIFQQHVFASESRLCTDSSEVCLDFITSSGLKRLWQRQWQWQTGGYQEGSLPWAAADTICVGQTPPHCSSTGSIFQLVHLCFFVQYPLCFLLLRSTVLNVLLERFFEILLKFWSAVCYWLWIILLWEVFLVCLQF